MWSGIWGPACGPMCLSHCQAAGLDAPWQTGGWCRNKEALIPTAWCCAAAGYWGQLFVSCSFGTSIFFQSLVLGLAPAGSSLGRQWQWCPQLDLGMALTPPGAQGHNAGCIQRHGRQQQIPALPQLLQLFQMGLMFLQGLPPPPLRVPGQLLVQVRKEICRGS